MRFGVQGPVIAWDDPWHRESCKTLMRTGERKWFPSQDVSPDAHEFIGFIRDRLGVDFYVHHVMPVDAEIAAFIDDMADCGMDFLMGNEYGNANALYSGHESVRRARRIGRAGESDGAFLGLLYDETEHLQINNTIYQSDKNLYQWVNPAGKSLAETEEGLVESVHTLVEKYGCDVYAEVLFRSCTTHSTGRGCSSP